MASPFPANCVLVVSAKIYVFSVPHLPHGRLLRWPSYCSCTQFQGGALRNATRRCSRALRVPHATAAHECELRKERGRNAALKNDARDQVLLLTTGEAKALLQAVAASKETTLKALAQSQSQYSATTVLDSFVMSSYGGAAKRSAVDVVFSDCDLHEDAARCFLEAFHRPDEEGSTMMNAKSSCKVVTFLSVVDAGYKKRMGEAKVTFTWTKSTGRVQIHTWAVYVDKVQERLEEYIGIFSRLINDEEVDMPGYGANLQDSLVQFAGLESEWIRLNRVADELKKSSADDQTVKSVETVAASGKASSILAHTTLSRANRTASNYQAAARAMGAGSCAADRTPPLQVNDPEAVELIQQLYNTGGYMLSRFPEIQERFLGVMLESFGAVNPPEDDDEGTQTSAGFSMAESAAGQ